MKAASRQPRPRNNNPELQGEIPLPLLPSQNRIALQEFKCKLPADLIADVTAYAVAIDSEVSYVVSKAIEKVIADKDFQAWKEQNQDKLQLHNVHATEKGKRGPKPKTKIADAPQLNAGKAVA
jgi:post-segregation antitoxin (ccd killing protein)